MADGSSGPANPRPPECTICAETLAGAGDLVTRCGHVFHAHCLLTWFEHLEAENKTASCPLCKEKPRRGPGGAAAFVRTLRGPSPLGAEEEAAMRAHAASGASADTVAARLDAAIARHGREIAASAAAREAEGVKR